MCNCKISLILLELLLFYTNISTNIVINLHKYTKKQKTRENPVHLLYFLLFLEDFFSSCCSSSTITSGSSSVFSSSASSSTNSTIS